MTGQWRSVPFLRRTCLLLLLVGLMPLPTAFSASAPSGSVAPADESALSASEAFFENQIRPLLAEHCIQCHGSEKQSGGLRLDTSAGLRAGGDSGPVISADDSSASLLLQVVAYDGDIQMPPDGPLPAAAVETLTHWVRQGAPWPQTRPPIASTSAEASASHWAFLPVQHPAVPVLPAAAPGIQADFLQNPIDAFVAQKLVEQGLAHSALADPRTLLRRLSYALTGLPPTADQVTQFVRDPSRQAYEAHVDRLLASPAYGEHWARHWLDIARYSDTKGYVYGREERFWVHAWSYRDWVVQALNEDLPYDRFLLLQIAADQTEDRRETDLAAMGFLTLGRRFLGVQRDIYDDRIDVVTRGTMSLTVGCARCHDHKYDPIPTADYYSLYGVFASSRERMVPLPADAPPDEAFRAELQQRLEKLNTTLQQKRITTAQRVRARVGDYLRAQFELERYPEEGFDQVIAPTDLLPSFVRRWQEYLRQTASQPHPVMVAWHLSQNSAAAAAADASGWTLPPGTNPLVAAAFPQRPQSRDELINGYATLFGQIDQQWQALQTAATEKGEPAPQHLADSAAEEIRQVLYGDDSPCVVPDEPVVHTEYDFDSGTCTELWKLQGEVDRWLINAPVPPPYAVILEDRDHPTTPRVFKRGNPARKGEEVPRQFLKLLSGPDRQPFQTGSGRYELARAIIDPENPLTARVIVNRVWAHHFGTGLVGTPGDFGTRADPPSHPELLDWLASQLMQENWSLKSLHRRIVTSGTWRQSSFGPAEPAQLAAAQQKDPANRLLWRMNTHRLSFEEMRDSMLLVSEQLDRTPGGKPADLFARPFPVRRTLYGLIDRQFLPGTLRMFDFASPDLHVPQRSDTTVPQQALFLMNHPSMLQHARELAANVATQSESPEHTVHQLYDRILQRAPRPDELADAVGFLNADVAEVIDMPPLTAEDWSYGYGGVDEQAGRVTSFNSLPHFTGTAWQGGAAFPDPALGWVQLTASGGHPGNDAEHASIRRWTAPRNMTIQIQSEAVHEPAAGDGIRVRIVSSHQGILQSAQVHQQTKELNVQTLAVVAGETLDFVCDIGGVLNSDQHFWRIRIDSADDTPSSSSSHWNSETDFTRTTAQQLTPLEQLAQVLLCSNEFLFVD